MRYFFTILVLFFSLASYSQRDTIAINDQWQFSMDKKAAGLNEKWFEHPLPGARVVKLPHTWNVEEENQNHYGWGWYQKKITVPASWKNKHVVLQFGAINHTSFIYVNGKKISENIGDGFNKLFIVLDDQLKYGKENIITVAVNNDYGKNKVPFANSFDWPNDGGLIRTAALIVSGKPSASYLHAVPQLNLKDSSGTLALKLGLDEKAGKNLRLHITVREENQSTQKVILEKTTSPTLINGVVQTTFNLDRINPWHIDFPNLYRIDVTILNGKKATDKITATVGFRDFRFVNGQTFLNGERIKLMGVEWTAGSNPKYGFAEPIEEITRHGKLMKDVNCIFSRQHFQQDDAFFDFCDRNGILLQEEVPLWGGETPSNDTIRSIASLQLERMIRNHYNHPSIFAWGVGNELNGRDAGIKKMVEDLVAKARSLDTTRMVSYVSNTITHGFSNASNFVPDAGSYGDYIMMNEYGGSWWPVPTGQIHRYLDSVHMSYPDKPFFISEFGLCEPNFKGGDERRLQDLIYHMAIYESKPYVEGAIYFDLTDYRTHYPGTKEENKYRRRIHGVYDMYGKPKPSMKVLRDLSSPIEIQTMNKWKKDKLSILVFGSIGLPQHAVKGYKLYLSDSTGNYKGTKAYDIPFLKPGESAYIEVDDLYNGTGVVTIARPTGYVATQKSFY